MLPSLWQQFGEGRVSCSNTTVPQHTKHIKTWFDEFAMEKDWAAESPDLNPIKHLWDEMEQRLQVRPTVLINALQNERAIPQKCSKMLWKTFQEEWALLSLQKGDQVHIKVSLFEYNVIIVPLGIMVRRPNTFIHII